MRKLNQWISNQAIGRQLMLGAMAMLGITMLMSFTALRAISTLGEELEVTASKTTRKVEIGGAVAAGAAEMLSDERNLLLRLALTDQPSADRAHQNFKQRASEMEARLEELQALTLDESGHQIGVNLSSAMAAWLPQDQEMWQACSKQDFLTAFQIFDQKVFPQAAKMQQLVAQLSITQKELLAQSQRRAADLPAHSRWMAFGFLSLAVAFGGLAMVVVRRITRSMHHMAESMAATASELTRAGAEISTSSEELAEAAAAQAAALEQTSASSHEVSVMAQSNADRAHLVADVMQQVEAEVSQADQKLGVLVASMDDIGTSSQRIGQIMKVIDEIAFQTNMLALNAAVEAARAGEAGLGFAVVADEVRSLAQRCSQAAKDTSNLIEEALKTANAGNQAATAVAQVVSGITRSAVKAKSMVDEVHAGSREQSVGMEQMSSGLIEIQRVTQQTVTNAEQSAAASQKMDAQAKTLHAIVEQLSAMVQGADRVPEPVQQSTVPSRVTVKAYRPSVRSH